MDRRATRYAQIKNTTKPNDASAHGFQSQTTDGSASNTAWICHGLVSYLHDRIDNIRRRDSQRARETPRQARHGSRNTACQRPTLNLCLAPVAGRAERGRTPSPEEMWLQLKFFEAVPDRHHGQRSKDGCRPNLTKALPRSRRISDNQSTFGKLSRFSGLSFRDRACTASHVSSK